jgi:hypothetical protein
MIVESNLMWNAAPGRDTGVGMNGAFGPFAALSGYYRTTGMFIAMAAIQMEMAGRSAAITLQMAHDLAALTASTMAQMGAAITVHIRFDPPEMMRTRPIEVVPGRSGVVVPFPREKHRK